MVHAPRPTGTVHEQAAEPAWPTTLSRVRLARQPARPSSACTHTHPHAEPRRVQHRWFTSGAAQLPCAGHARPCKCGPSAPPRPPPPLWDCHSAGQHWCPCVAALMPHVISGTSAMGGSIAPGRAPSSLPPALRAMNCAWPGRTCSAGASSPLGRTSKLRAPPSSSAPEPEPQARQDERPHDTAAAAAAAAAAAGPAAAATVPCPSSSPPCCSCRCCRSSHGEASAASGGWSE